MQVDQCGDGRGLKRTLISKANTKLLIFLSIYDVAGVFLYLVIFL